MRKVLLILLCVAALAAGCDKSRCYDGTANEYQRVMCP